ncbi:MAG: CRISPR-associated endonuclease Cas1 [Burkholderiaceae bacterium]
MDTLVIDQRGTCLAQQAGALVIRLPNQRPHSVPFGQISRIILAGSVNIDSTLLTHLAEHGISLIAMPGRGARRNAFLYGMGHGDASRRLGQYRLIQCRDSLLRWARHFVSLKIIGDRRLLMHALFTRPDLRLSLTRGIDGLQSALKNAQRVDNVASLRGVEGAASARFFAAYRSLFAPALEFNDRNRRPPRDPVNAALSLGYTLAHSDALRAITQAGLDPMLGFLHDPDHSRESMACDFVEMSRPRIERLVWRLFAERTLCADQFTLDGGASRMGKAARQVFFPAYEQQAGIHRTWFRRYSSHLARTCVAHFSSPCEGGRPEGSIP